MNVTLTTVDTTTITPHLTDAEAGAIVEALTAYAQSILRENSHWYTLEEAAQTFALAARVQRLRDLVEMDSVKESAA